MTGVQRTRAGSVQDRAVAASIVVGVLTVLVGADPLDIRGSSSLFRGLDYALLVCWVVVIMLLLFAQLDADSRARCWLRAAFYVSLCAGVFTVLLLFAKAMGISTDYDSVLVTVKGPELASIARFCERPGREMQLYGRVQTGSLGDEFIVLKLYRNANSTCNEIKVPREQIVAFIEHPCTMHLGVDLSSSALCGPIR